MLDQGGGLASGFGGRFYTGVVPLGLKSTKVYVSFA